MMDHGIRKARLALLGAVLAGGAGLAAAQVPAQRPDTGVGVDAGGNVRAAPGTGRSNGGVAAGVNANNGINTGTPGTGSAGTAATGNAGIASGADASVSGAAGSATGSTNATGTLNGSLQCPPPPGTVAATDCRAGGGVNGAVNSSGDPLPRR